MNFQGALERFLIIVGSLLCFVGIALGVAVYNETVKPLWLKDYERALSLESIDRPGAIKLLRQSLVEAEKADAPLSSQKQITQKLGDYLYTNFSQSDAARIMQTNNPQTVTPSAP
jgi:hypothetical protein